MWTTSEKWLFGIRIFGLVCSIVAIVMVLTKPSESPGEEGYKRDMAAQVVDVVPIVRVDVKDVPVVVEKTVVTDVLDSPVAMSELGVYTVRGFCSCGVCKENSAKVTNMNDKAGITASVDSTVIPFGEKIWAEGIGIRQTQPSNQVVSGNEIAVYMSSHEEVEAFGVQELTIYKLEE